LPPLTSEPPLEAVYQSIVIPLGTVALKVTVPDPQRALALAPVGTAGKALTVAVLVAAFADWHVIPSAVLAYTVAVLAPSVEVSNVYDEPLAVPADAVHV
jgi:hypothetical protein